MSRFRPGDSAMIIGATHLPDNIGKVVILISFHEAKGLFRYPNSQEIFKSRVDENFWVVEGEGLLLRRFDNLSPEGRIISEGFTLSKERHLMPLRGDDEQFKLEAIKDKRESRADYMRRQIERLKDVRTWDTRK